MLILFRYVHVPIGCTVRKIFYFLHHAAHACMHAAWPNLDPVGSFSFSFSFSFSLVDVPVACMHGTRTVTVLILQGENETNVYGDSSGRSSTLYGEVDPSHACPFDLLAYWPLRA